MKKLLTVFLLFQITVPLFALTMEGVIDSKGGRFYISVDQKETEVRVSRESKKLPELLKEAAERGNTVELTGEIGKDGSFYCRKFRTVKRTPKPDAPPQEKKR